MAPKNVKSSTPKHCNNPINMRLPQFAEQCWMQVNAAAQADAQDQALEELMNEALDEIEDWTE